MNYNRISGFSDEIAENIEEQFQVLNKLNISYFEPRGINGKNISTLNDDEINELAAVMKNYGIRVSSIGSPIGKVKLEDSFDEHFEVFKRVVKTAKMLDAKYIRMFSFYHEGGSEWTQDERAEVLRRLEAMITYAKQEDVILLHENEKDIYGDTAERCLDLMKELSCSHFKAVFDPANFVQCKQDTKEAYEMLKDYIEYVHIKDALYADESVVPAGDGDGNVAYILGELLKNGFDGFLSLEPHLGSFAGIGSLGGRDQRMKDLPAGGEGTFTLAYRALAEILNGIA